METIYTNTDFIRLKNDKPQTSLVEADNDVHGKSEEELDWNLKTKGFEEKEVSHKRVLVILGISLLTALLALCILGTLYSKQLGSYDLLQQHYINAADSLAAQEKNATEMEKRYQQLEAKHNSTTDRLSSCSYKVIERKRYYYFSTEKLNWMQSQDYCVKTGGQLVKIKSKEDQDYLTSIVKETHWIGLHDLHTEGHWTWVDNTTVSGDTFWYERPDEPNEPDNWKVEDPNGENCASLGNEIGLTSWWFDSLCTKLKKFICEK